MRVMIAGGAGYVGSSLCRELIALGHEVTVIDIGLFGTEHVPAEANLIVEDVLRCRPEWLEGMDGVVNLAGLSNDPMAHFSPRLNYEQNAAAAAYLAQTSREAGVHRFVQASTCSVYGFSDACEADETHSPRPAFPYAISKLMAERAMWCLESEDFRPIILRKGTVIGWSPRMRYDLVANTMVKSALTTGCVVVHNPDLWRPVIDITDAAHAYVLALQAPLSLVGTFNIACGNFTILEIAEEVVAVLRRHGCSPRVEVNHRQDPRSYRVSTDLARAALGFEPRVTVEQSVERLLRRIRHGINSDLMNPRYVNIEWLQQAPDPLPLTA